MNWFKDVMWPWQHRKEALAHIRYVEATEHKVDAIYNEAQKQKRENGIGEAVSIALSGRRKGHR